MIEPERPKPEYGEYASDEEYASALKRSGFEPKQEEAPTPPFSGVPQNASHRASHSPLTSTPRGHEFLDRIVTIFLLAFGIVSIIGGAPNYLNLAKTLQDTISRIGMGEYHASALTSGFGVAMLASQVILWVIAAVWSFRRLSSRKRAWWIPVVAGVLSFIVLTVLLGILLAGDPSLVPPLQ